MKKITRSQLRDLEVPVPGLGEQASFIRKIDERMPAFRKLSGAAKEELEATKALPAALLRQAFAGEL
jgi:hypothetical protein